MTPDKGVHPRPDSSVWSYYVLVPDELRHRFKTKFAYRKSLGTRDLREANSRARVIAGEWAQRFAAMLLEERAQPADRITPGMAALLAERVAAKVLQADEALRGDPHAVQQWVRLMATLEHGALSPLTIGKPPAPPPPAHLTASLDPWEGLPGELLGDLGRLNEGADLHAAQALAGGRVAAVERQAYAEGRALGFTFTRATPGALEAMRACLRAYREAWADVRARDAGKPVQTPPLRALPQQASEAPAESQGKPQGRRMVDALEAWEGLALRKPKTLSVFRRHVAQFREMTGDPLLSDITKATASKFTADLQRWAVDNGKTRETADNVLASIKALAGVATREGWMDANRFAGMAVTAGGKEAAPREPWTPEELPRLFASPIFKAYRVPLGDTAAERKAGLDAAYWVPLLCLFTGARPGEVCQLWTDDLSEVKDTKGRPLLVLEFRANKDRGQTLKNPSSWRALPIHSELLRLGLRDYWLAIIEAQGGKAGPLFPALQLKGANGPAGQFGQWFGEFKTARGFDTAKTLHSFRHTAETELGFAEVSPTLVDAITGHEGQGVGRKQYGATIRRSAVRLRPHLERLQFPGLDLPRVYKAPAWKP